MSADTFKSADSTTEWGKTALQVIDTSVALAFGEKQLPGYGNTQSSWRERANSCFSAMQGATMGG